MISFDTVQGGAWHFRTKGKKALCDHSELWGPLRLLRMSYDLSGDLTRWRAVMGYSTICLSRGLQSRWLSRMKILHFNIWTRITFRLCQSKIGYFIPIGILKGQWGCVTAWANASETRRRRLVSRKKRSLYVEVTGPSHWEILYFFGIPERGQRQSRAFLALTSYPYSVSWQASLLLLVKSENHVTLSERLLVGRIETCHSILSKFALIQNKDYNLKPISGIIVLTQHTFTAQQLNSMPLLYKASGHENFLKQGQSYLALLLKMANFMGWKNTLLIASKHTAMKYGHGSWCCSQLWVMRNCKHIYYMNLNFITSNLEQIKIALNKYFSLCICFLLW